MTVILSRGRWVNCKLQKFLLLIYMYIYMWIKWQFQYTNVAHSHTPLHFLWPLKHCEWIDWSREEIWSMLVWYPNGKYKCIWIAGWRGASLYCFMVFCRMWSIYYAYISYVPIIVSLPLPENIDNRKCSYIRTIRIWNVDIFIVVLQPHHCLVLTHCGLVTPYGDSYLGQLWLM